MSIIVGIETSEGPLFELGQIEDQGGAINITGGIRRVRVEYRGEKPSDRKSGVVTFARVNPSVPSDRQVLGLARLVESGEKTFMDLPTGNGQPLRVGVRRI